jgi:uncharacterized membrane protein
MSTLQSHRVRAQSAGPDHWDLLYVSLNPLPAALLAAALASDLLYWLGSATVFAYASEWLLAAVLCTGAFAATEGLVLYISVGRIRPSKVALVHAVGYGLALLLSLSNLIYRLVEGARAGVVPAGAGLTAASFLLLLAAGRLGRGIAIECGQDESDEFDLP